VTLHVRAALLKDLCRARANIKRIWVSVIYSLYLLIVFFQSISLSKRLGVVLDIEIKSTFIGGKYYE